MAIIDMIWPKKTPARPIELRDRVIHPNSGKVGVVTRITKGVFTYPDMEDTFHQVQVNCGPKLGVVTFNYEDLEHYVPLPRRLGPTNLGGTR